MSRYDITCLCLLTFESVTMSQSVVLRVPPQVLGSISNETTQQNVISDVEGRTPIHNIQQFHNQVPHHTHAQMRQIVDGIVEVVPDDEGRVRSGFFDVLPKLCEVCTYDPEQDVGKVEEATQADQVHRHPLQNCKIVCKLYF